MFTNILTDASAVIYFAILLSLSSLWCLGLATLFQKDMLLSNLGVWLDSHLPVWVNKPVWRCPPCMASVHGSLSYLIFFYGDYGLLWWPLFVVCLVGVNRILSNWI